LHDKYFTHKGKLSDKNGFLSVLSPTGEVIKEDFGMCDEENRGSEVVGDLLYVNGANKVCVYNTDSFETLPSIGEGQLDGAALTGIAHDPKANLLWVAGSNMIARIDLSQIPPKVIKTPGLVTKSKLHPNGIAVDPKNGDLLVTNSEGGTDEGASVHSCVVAPLGAVVCAPVEVTARLGEAGDVLIGPDGAAYFMLADNNTGSPKVHRLSVQRNALSELLLDDSEQVCGLGYDSSRGVLLLPTCGENTFFTADPATAGFTPMAQENQRALSGAAGLSPPNARVLWELREGKKSMFLMEGPAPPLRRPPWRRPRCKVLYSVDPHPNRSQTPKPHWWRLLPCLSPSPPRCPPRWPPWWPPWC